MLKIHVARQFFEANGRHGDFFEKTNNLFSDKDNGCICAKFQVCIVFHLARRRDTNTYTYTSEIRSILDRLLASHGF